MSIVTLVLAFGAAAPVIAQGPVPSPQEAQTAPASGSAPPPVLSPAPAIPPSLPGQSAAVSPEPPPSGTTVPAPPAASGEAQAPAKPEGHAGNGGEIVVSGRAPSRADPLVKLNFESYQAIQAVDKVFVGPVAKGYKAVMPKPLRLGLRNFLRNLDEPVIAFNYVLQIKPGRAVKSVGRFAINSTVGVGGLVDVAKNKPFHLPYTPNGFANTFACYGIGPGPYFFLPLVGPTTLRDVIGVSLDRFLPPLVIGKPLNQPYYAIPAAVIDQLNDRIEIDDQQNEIRDNSADPYVATRELYLSQRKSEIAAICPKKGEAPDKDLPPRPGKGRD
jgi:phospholipid-binding lipoprotein MlaA